MTFPTDTLIKELVDGLSLSLTKNSNTPRESAIAYSLSGKKYLAGRVESDTHLLDISAVQAVLHLAVQHTDFQINKVISMQEDKEGEKGAVSPIDLKVLIDFSRRTNKTLSYQNMSTSGETLFETPDVYTTLPFYKPIRVNMPHLNALVPTSNKNSLVKTIPLAIQLKKAALEGMQRALTTSPASTSYGAAVVTKSGKIYSSGQYSSFEKRTNIHAEMGAVVSALMAKDYEITHIAVCSSKHKNVSCPSCGCCRQFFVDIEKRLKLREITLLTFASGDNVFEEMSLKKALPNSWSSKI